MVGRRDKALASYRAGALAGDLECFWEAVDVMREDGHEAAFASLLGELGETDIPHTPSIIAQKARRTGDIGLALSIYEEMARAGDEEALVNAAYLLQEEGRIDEALEYYMRAMEAGSSDALEEACMMLEENKRDEDIARLTVYGIEPGARMAAPWTYHEVVGVHAPRRLLPEAPSRDSNGARPRNS